MKTKNRPLDICATVTDWSDIEAKAGDDSAEPRRLRRFAMTAYTGGQMDLAGWKHPVVVDLSGLEIASQTRPLASVVKRGRASFCPWPIFCRGPRRPGMKALAAASAGLASFPSAKTRTATERP